MTMNMKVYVKFLLIMLMKQKMILFSKHKKKQNQTFFGNFDLKFQPRT